MVIFGACSNISTVVRLKRDLMCLNCITTKKTVLSMKVAFDMLIKSCTIAKIPARCPLKIDVFLFLPNRTLMSEKLGFRIHLMKI